jgi:hypothetical protein
LTGCNTSERTLTELKIAQAYVRLSCIPADSPEASVSLASIGSYEISMVRWPEVDLDAVPLFWLELFDHQTKTAVDSFRCHRIKDAVPIFDDFVAQAGGSIKSDGSDR